MLKVISLIILINTSTFAREKYYTDDSVLIDGYDPVSYIKFNKAIKGDETIKVEYDGVKVYFSNEESKKLFLKSPKKYLPAYGGWCAYALSIDEGLVEIDPKSFKVINGKTYLFYNSWLVNTLKKWNMVQNDVLQVELANKSWNKLK